MDLLPSSRPQRRMQSFSAHHSLQIVEGSALAQGGSALCEEGETFIAHLGLGEDWGEPISSPRPAVLPAACIEVAAGALHSLFLCSAGVVYSCGGGWEGPLGHGDQGSHAIPRPLALGVHVANIAAGSAHSLAADAQGAVWSWGWGRHGQLGHGDERSQSSPCRIAGLGGVVQVAAGAAHSLALATDGTVYSFGRASAGQCGHGACGEHAPGVLVPVRVDALAHIQVREVRASADTSAACIAALVYRWGTLDASNAVPLPILDAEGAPAFA